MLYLYWLGKLMIKPLTDQQPEHPTDMNRVVIMKGVSEDIRHFDLESNKVLRMECIELDEKYSNSHQIIGIIGLYVSTIKVLRWWNVILRITYHIQVIIVARYLLILVSTCKLTTAF